MGGGAVFVVSVHCIPLLRRAMPADFEAGNLHHHAASVRAAWVSDELLCCANRTWRLATTGDGSHPRHVQPSGNVSSMPKATGGSRSCQPPCRRFRKGKPGSWRMKTR